MTVSLKGITRCLLTLGGFINWELFGSESPHPSNGAASQERSVARPIPPLPATRTADGVRNAPTWTEEQYRAALRYVSEEFHQEILELNSKIIACIKSVAEREAAIKHQG